MATNPDFLCSLRMRFVGVEANDLIIDGEIGFAPAGTFIRDSNVWQYDGVFIIGSAHVSGDGFSEAYLGMTDCLNELFSLPRPAKCA